MKSDAFIIEHTELADMLLTLSTVPEVKLVHHYSQTARTLHETQKFAQKKYL
jgi:hypothetical protein